MFTQPEFRLQLAEQIQRERLAAADRHRLAGEAVAPPERTRRRPRRLARTVLTFAGVRLLGG